MGVMAWEVQPELDGKELRRSEKTVKGEKDTGCTCRRSRPRSLEMVWSAPDPCSGEGGRRQPSKEHKIWGISRSVVSVQGDRVKDKKRKWQKSSYPTGSRSSPRGGKQREDAARIRESQVNAKGYEMNFHRIVPA